MTENENNNKYANYAYFLWLHHIDNSISTFKFGRYREALKYLAAARKWHGKEAVYEWKLSHKSGIVVTACPAPEVQVTEWTIASNRLNDSFLLPFKQKGIPPQWRRYYPLYGEDLNECIDDAFTLVYNRRAKDQAQIGMAMLYHGFDKKIQKINGKFYLRTTMYLPDW